MQALAQCKKGAERAGKGAERAGKNNNKMFDGRYLRAKKNMSAFDVAVQPEHVTDKEYIGTLLAQIKAQQETYNILYNRNLVLYNELKTMNAYAMQLQMPEVHEAVMKDLTESHASIADLWKEIKALNLHDGTDAVIAMPCTLQAGQNREQDLTPAELRHLKEDTAEAIRTAYALKPPASALQALKTQADRRGLQLRCEDERVSEQEWRARIVLITSEGHATELPWSSVCLGLKRAKQAAAELALDIVSFSGTNDCNDGNAHSSSQ